MAPSVFSVLLLLAADKSPATSQPADQIQVEPIAVWEMRARISHPVLRSNKLTPGDLGPDKVGVDVIARMQGAPLRNVRSYRVRVWKASDDLGRYLETRQSSDCGFVSINALWGPFIPVDLHQLEPGGLISIRLLEPSRRATRIKLIKGEVQARMGGEPVVLKLPKVRSLVDAKLNDPVLKSAGIGLKLIDANTPMPPEHRFIKGADELGIIASGPVDSPHFLSSAAVLDQKGQQIGKLSFSVMSGGFRFDTIKMDKAPDDTMTLKLELLIGEKTITVPFELEDIELS